MAITIAASDCLRGIKPIDCPLLRSMPARGQTVALEAETGTANPNGLAAVGNNVP
jgi:hypothetical protein